MNKENKNNETFSDIFSSIEKKDLDSKETISFNSITKSSDKKLNFSDLTKTIDESKSNKDSKSIFKIAQEKEKLSNPSTTITNSINNINDLNLTEEKIVEVEEKNPFFDDIKLPEDNKTLPKNESSIETNNEEKIVEVEEKNPFFNDIKLSEENKTLPKNESSIETNNEEKIVEVEEKNSFFDDIKLSEDNKTQPKNESSIETNNEEKIVEVEEKNPFFNDIKLSEENKTLPKNESSIETNNEEKIVEVEEKNPFFDDIKLSEDNKTLPKNESSIETNNEEKIVEVEEKNPFFNDIKLPEENKTPPKKESSIETNNEEKIVEVEEKNPFFDDIKLSEENKTQPTNEPLKETNNEDKKEEAKKINSSKDSNPFFKDEEEISNPFLNNKINFIENSTYSTNSDSTGKIDTSTVPSFDVKIVKKKEPLIKFILGVISYAIFIWLLLIGIVLLIYVADIKIRASKGDNSPPKYNAYVVLTGSMLPEIQVYDVVITKRVETKDLEKGDVITFASSDSRFLNTIITHRIISKNYNAETNTYTFQTKGDNNNVADSALVDANNIYGKVIFKIPKLGYLQEFLASDGGWIIVILIPCLAVISYDIVKLIKGIKRKKYKNIKVQK